MKKLLLICCVGMFLSGMSVFAEPSYETYANNKESKISDLSIKPTSAFSPALSINPIDFISMLVGGDGVCISCIG